MALRIPTTIPLPVLLVKLLEGKQESQAPLAAPEALQWRELRSSLEQTLATMRRFASHPELVARSEKADQILSELHSAMLEDTYEKALSLSFQLYQTLAQYGRVREELRVTQLDQIDKLIHATQAVGLGGITLGEARELLPSAIAEVDGMVGFFKTASDALPEDIRVAFLQGIKSVQNGFVLLQNPDPSGEKLKNAAVDLRNGALILQELQKWGRELALEERSAVPAVGDFVQVLRDELQEDGQLKATSLEEWLDTAFWELQERWSGDRHDLFMPRMKKDQLVESIDTLMHKLKELHEYTPREQDELLYLLEIRFEEVERHGFDLELLASHSSPWLGDYLVAVLAQGVPRPHIESQVRHLVNTELEIYGQLLGSYLEEDDRDFILDALERLQTEVETMPTYPSKA